MLIKTERLILKDLSMEDLEGFFEYASNKEVGTRSTWKPHESLEESREILGEFVDSKEFFSIYTREDGKFIGIVGLHEDELKRMPKEKCREIGYGLHYDYWGKGYMAEASKEVIKFAFENLGLELITGYTSKENKRSKRVLEKIGLKYEGLLRKAWHNYKGDYRDRYCYSILREEYRNF